MTVRQGRKSETRLQTEFQQHYGLTPLDVAEVWYDLCYYDKKLLPKQEKTERGFKYFLAALHWLWAKPKNASLLASRFDVSLDYARGARLWKWIERIAGLSEKKIKWDDSIIGDDTEIFGLSTDGVDFKLWERQHPTYPVDTKAMSHKFRACAAKYIIVLSVFRSKCLFIEGPFRGGKHDLTMFKESGLMRKLETSNKICIADRGFRSKRPCERENFGLPDYMDSKELNNFKSRARLRQETYNRRLKHFECLAGTFKNGFLKHGIALRAVAVLVQYQMDNGSPLYCV